MERRSSRKRPCGGTVLHLHAEAQCETPTCTEEEEEKEMKRKRKRGGATGCKRENEPVEVLQKNMRTLKREPRWFSQTGTQTRAGSGFQPVGEVQSFRPEVRLARIRKTRIQTSVRNPNDGDCGLTEQTNPKSQLDQGRPAQVTDASSTDVSSVIKSMSRSRSTPALLRIKVLGPEHRSSRPERVMCQGPGRREEPPQMIGSTSMKRNAMTRRRTKVHPSVFRGRGQLHLSITPEAGHLTIHIHQARGLMGKSNRSCDSYVQLAVTSDLDCRIVMTSPTVLNSKNPEYKQSFTQCINENLLRSRLLVSVISRSRQLIGCTSFGISSLISSLKRVSGWFYLLGAEFGGSKHLRVTSQQKKPVRSLKEEAAENTPTHCAELKKTPDSTSDPDLKPISTTTASITSLSNRTRTTTAGLKDLTNQNLEPNNSNYSSNPANANHSSFVPTLCTGTNPSQGTRTSTQRLTVNIVRGKDGFGFTICSDCPVKVQAVDSGGPAHQSGLRQGDSVLQLNGLPVETWKCVDLAHAIRRCPSHIVLVVWRGLPELKSGWEALLRPPAHNTTTGRKLLPHPTHSKHGRRRGQGLGVRSSLGALGSLWRDKKEEKEEAEEEDEEVTEYSPCTTTLKGTRVTSSNGDNYIILSPVNTGEQLLQPVYHDRNGTLGRLYQTHPSRGQNLLHDARTGLAQRPFHSHTSTLPPSVSTSSSSAPPSNCGNYQNCTMVQSHLPCSSYGTCTTLAPKTLIFPIFVQPLDLCSPDRTLLMAEEMVLHQANLLPAKVTVLIYSDLLLFTREDEAGRCNVLQSPLYLNTLQLTEVSSEPLHIYFLQNSASGCRCLFSLEAFSLEQRIRVSLCLHDNIQLQLVAMELGHAHQLSDLPSDFGLLSLRQSDLLYRPSSPYSSICDPLRPSSPSLYSPGSPFTSSTPPPPFSSLSPYTSSSPPSRAFTTSSQLSPPPRTSSSNTQRSPVWKERGAEEKENRRRTGPEEAVEERQQGEGESASETSEQMGGVGGLQLSPTHFNMKEEEGESDEEEEGRPSDELLPKFRPEGLRRSLSEGSLLQEPRSPRFLSDSTIHRLTGPPNWDLKPAPGPPSIHTLKKQLTREGGSLHHMLLFLNGTKDVDHLRQKTRSLAADVRSRLLFLRQRRSSICVHSNSLEKALRNNRPSTREVLRWAESLEALLTNQYGLAVFRHFLRSEFSEENLDFWLAVERFKKTRSANKMAVRAAKIYDEFISTTAGRQVNVDSSVRESTYQSLHPEVNAASFQLAQDQIFSLMETDSYPRFLRSRLYAQLASQGTQIDTETTN